MQSHSVSNIRHRSSVSTRLKGKSGIRFFVIGTIATFVVPSTVMSLYVPNDTGKQTTAINQENKHNQEDTRSLDQNPETEDEAGAEADIPAVSTTNEKHTSTELKVNNQTIPLPDNGTTSTTIHDNNGTTKIDVSINSNTSTSGSSNSNSSTNIQLDTATETEAINSEYD